MGGTIELITERLPRRHVMEDARPLHENFGLDEAVSEHSGWNPYATPEAAEEAVAGNRLGQCSWLTDPLTDEGIIRSARTEIGASL